MVNTILIPTEISWNRTSTPLFVNKQPTLLFSWTFESWNPQIYWGSLEISRLPFQTKVWARFHSLDNIGVRPVWNCVSFTLSFYFTGKVLSEMAIDHLGSYLCADLREADTRPSEPGIRGEVLQGWGWRGLMRTHSRRKTQRGLFELQIAVALRRIDAT